jgi:hypothetical protein
MRNATQAFCQTTMHITKNAFTDRWQQRKVELKDLAGYENSNYASAWRDIEPIKCANTTK